MIVAQLLIELCLLTFEVYCFCTCVSYLEKASSFLLSRKNNIGIISKGESMCDICKKKDPENKRIFKACRHTFCRRCFLRHCIQLCQCTHCDIVQFECHICRKT